MTPRAVLAALLASSCQGGQWVIGEEVEAVDEPGPSVVLGDSYGCESAEQLLAERATWHGVSQVGSRHVGRWLGRLSGIAANDFPSLDVELRLGEDHKGTLVFVGVERPPAPKAALEGYLCDGSVSGGICGSASGFVGGFDYELSGITVRRDVLSFVVIDADPWGAWCELQKPLERVDTLAACGHSWSALSLAMEPRWSMAGCAQVAGDGSEEPIDCDVMYALERCECSFDGCFAGFREGIEVGLNLSDDEQELRGSLWFKSSVAAALLRLRRQP